MDSSAGPAANDRFHPFHGDSSQQQQQHHEQPSHGSSPSPSQHSNPEAEHRRRLALARESIMRPFYPGQEKSLSGIALRAFCLGISLTIALTSIALILLFSSSSSSSSSSSPPSSSSSSFAPNPLWRVPFFLAALSTFHFLEFWTTAEGNPTVASVDSFLLTSNWPSYAIAHSAAFLECFLVGYFFPHRAWVPEPLARALLLAGLALTLAGQFVRSLAMLQAGVSFNHYVQTKRADTHALVTTGMYAFVRHPAYAAFFYWGLGTQLVLGNVVCFAGYAAALWFFFSRRIRVEEQKLVEFFHEDYVNYRKRVGTLMPFIR